MPTDPVAIDNLSLQLEMIQVLQANNRDLRLVLSWFERDAVRLREELASEKENNHSIQATLQDLRNSLQVLRRRNHQLEEVLDLHDPSASTRTTLFGINPDDRPLPPPRIRPGSLPLG
jgi:cell division protein FtsB